MNRLYAPAIIGVAVLLSTVLSAQTQPALETAQKTASVAKLFPPVYPPLARQARITGEVRISLHLRPDGAVESAEVIDGHPMLKQAALESARKSEFACTNCVQTVAVYSLVYDFEIGEGCHFGPHCQHLDSDQPVITQSPGRVVISAAPACLCDPSATRIRIRAAKCLYLWKCGHRDITDE
jgi:TonB family protein